MALYQGRFLIARDEREGDTWAEPGGPGVRILCGKVTEPEKGRLLLAIPADQVERLAAWAQPRNLLVAFTGLLAQKVREEAARLGLTPQNFVVEAVNAFIQAGEMAEHRHGPPSQPPSQEIQLEPPPRASSGGDP